MSISVRRKTCLRVALCVFALISFCNFCQGVTSFFYNRRLPNIFSIFSKQYPSKEIQQSLFLNEKQCREIFPGLMKEINDAVARGPFELAKEPDDYMGMVQARIKNEKLYIITAEHGPNRDMLFKRDAVLNQLYRAIFTSPTPLPDTIFKFSIIDTQRENGWSFARSNDPNMNGNFWIMPHFFFFSWPKQFIRTMEEALERIDQIEESTPWEKKIDKVVWRGTGWFNSMENTQLRPNLLAATKGKDWADVEVLKWEMNENKANNAIGIEDNNRIYRSVYYTLSMWLYHYYPTAKFPHAHNPLHAASLLLISSFSPSANSKVGAGANPRWPKSYSPTQANIVFVDPEWKDLEDTVKLLRKNEDIAQGIARRQREQIAKGGYLSPAAEVCYWRSLITGWHQVAKPNEELWGSWDSEGVENGEGMGVETFSLTGKVQWDQKKLAKGD